MIEGKGGNIMVHYNTSMHTHTQYLDFQFDVRRAYVDCFTTENAMRTYFLFTLLCANQHITNNDSDNNNIKLTTTATTTTEEKEENKYNLYSTLPYGISSFTSLSISI